MILIPLKFRGKPFLGLAQLSKIFIYLFSVNINPPRHRFGFSLAWDWQLIIFNAIFKIKPPFKMKYE
jgi:hypothetical protein